jgi:hypothetical protein
MQRIYVHNIFSNTLVHKLTHNTIDREIDSEKGIVKCKYNNLELEFIFDINLNDNEDGLHLIDFYSIIFEIRNRLSKNFNDLDFDKGDDYPILKRLSELLENKKNWLIFLFRTEKIDTANEPALDGVKLEIPLDEIIKKLSNHTFITDNIFLNDRVKNKFPNFHYAFSNSIFQWNEMIGIRWYYEYKDIFGKLNFNYDLGFSVRNYKEFRVRLLYNLSKQNNNKILLQRTDTCLNSQYFWYKDYVTKDNILLNSVIGKNDWENIQDISNIHIGLDLFMRVFSKSKMQILDESWGWNGIDYNSQYFSEKTIGFILSKIPFITTHPYPVYLIQKILDVPEYPFLKEADLYKGNPEKISEFIKNFMLNFDDNYKLCKEWLDIVHDKFIEKLLNENSFLDLLSKNFEKETTKNRLI